MDTFRRVVNGKLVQYKIDGVDQLLGATDASSAPTIMRAIPTAPEPWPLALLPLKLLAKEGDRGAGDIIARVIGPIGGDAFKTWYKRIFGKPCGCGARVETLNARYPL